MENEIVYQKQVLEFLDDLMFILFKNEYFSYQENAIQYVENLVHYISNNINKPPEKFTPKPLQKFAHYFFTYAANNHTTWYILYHKQEHRYIISHIFNNHCKEAQYFNL